jgi:hypothetical protein
MPSVLPSSSAGDVPPADADTTTSSQATRQDARHALSVRKAIPSVVKFVQAANSKLLPAPEATWLLTGVGLFKRAAESSRPFLPPTGGTVMVGFGPRNLTCEIESAGASGGIAATLCQQRDRKTPGQLPGRAFPSTETGDRVRQIDFGVGGIGGIVGDGHRRSPKRGDARDDLRFAAGFVTWQLDVGPARRRSPHL